MDSLNLLTPHPTGCPDLYAEYTEKRTSSLALTSNEMDEIEIDTSSEDQPEQPCSSFGVNKRFSALKEIYDAGDGIFFANIGLLQKPVDRNNFVAETKAQLFSHHDMKEEGFKVDVLRERDNTGVLGRMADVLGSNNMSVGQIAIDRSLSNVVGDPTLGRKVDILSRDGNGADSFYRVHRHMPGVSPSVLFRAPLLSQGYCTSTLVSHIFHLAH